MIIGIDASKAGEDQKTGVENFVYQLILHLIKIDSNNQYLLFSNKPLPKELRSENFKEIYIPFPKFWNKLRLPMTLLKYKPEIYIQPSYAIPSFAPKKTIAVCHDLAWVKFPQAYSKKELLLQKYALDNIAQNAAKIVCVSNSAAKDLKEYLPYTNSRIAVIYLGVNDQIEQKTTPKDFLGINSKYFISIGRLEERKNTKNIVEAFNRFKDLGFPYKLILVGSPGYGYDKILTAVKSSKYSKDIIIPGFIPTEKSNDLLSGAQALLYPSLYEGFGLAALEAMTAGTPVITSDSSSLPEVVGDTAILVDPLNIDEIFKAMEKIAKDENLRQSLIKKGLVQARKFSWETTAREYLKLMEEM